MLDYNKLDTPEVILTVDRLGQVIGRETVLECTIYGYPLETTHWMKNGIIVNGRCNVSVS